MLVILGTPEQQPPDVTDGSGVAVMEATTATPPTLRRSHSVPNESSPHLPRVTVTSAEDPTSVVTTHVPALSAVPSLADLSGQEDAGVGDNEQLYVTLEDVARFKGQKQATRKSSVHSLLSTSSWGSVGNRLSEDAWSYTNSSIVTTDSPPPPSLTATLGVATAETAEPRKKVSSGPVTYSQIGFQHKCANCGRVTASFSNTVFLVKQYVINRVTYNNTLVLHRCQTAVQYKTQVSLQSYCSSVHSALAMLTPVFGGALVLNVKHTVTVCSDVLMDSSAGDVLGVTVARYK